MAAKPGADRTRITVWSAVGFIVLMSILLIHHSNFIVGRSRRRRRCGRATVPSPATAASSR